MLYVMHVDWNWIWQRPQAIAAELAADPRTVIRVAYLPNWRRRHLAPNASAVRRQAIWQLPLGRLRVVRAINRQLGRASLRLLAGKFKPTAVLITYPTLLSMLPTMLDRVPLFYDCMDLASGFADGPDEVEALHRAEGLVANCATATFVSSDFIAADLSSRHPQSRLLLVRNGFGGLESRSAGDDASRFEMPGRVVRLGYFGTVSTWFDAGILVEALATRPWLEVHLWGPLVAALPGHSRLHIHSAVRHEDLADAVREVDALIMPFALSDLIRGVDPVKLYEYVSLGKPVISVYYPELEQFRGLVHFYGTGAELGALLDRLRVERNSMRPDAVAARSFLDAATWHSRATIILDEVSGVVSHRAASVPRGDL